MTTSIQNTPAPKAKKRAPRSLQSPSVPIERIGDDRFVAIEGYDRIPPFFCSLTSDADLWLFVSSTGALTAGRGDPDRAILPYETVDKIHDSGAHTGFTAMVRWREKGRAAIWEPFKGQAAEGVRRRLLKNLIGSRLVFEETNERQRLGFTSTLMISDRFGLVRECALRNIGDTACKIEVFHGIRNLVPSGVTRRLQSDYSCLADAYKQNEILAPAGPGVFSMASCVTDHPAPCEALRATVVWTSGLPGSARSVDPGSAAAFCRGETPVSISASRGVRGNYFEWGEVFLKPGEEARWLMVSDTALEQTAVECLASLIATGLPIRDVMEDVAKGEAVLRRRLAAADGLQETGDAGATAHHLANVLFNVMRGGIFPDGHGIGREDFSVFLSGANRALHRNHAEWLKTLPVTLPRDRFLEAVHERDCVHLERIFLEYLPLAFSRRHGDPSRPWNQFCIRTRDREGNEILDYQGNWRDIFQNWEALALSFPEYLENMISRFVNASTADGHNPYRISRDGIDWEVPEPGDPWASYGYWGDHQIVYLTRLLEAFEQHYPGALGGLLDRRRFTHANVPYRIKPLEKVFRDPRNTLVFDEELSVRLTRRAAKEGSDAKLVAGPDGRPALFTLMEKLLVPVLAKWSNFFPGGGIWMNTQRPEWNDANNALVGNGLSMVTLCHLRRHQAFLREIVSRSPDAVFSVSTAVTDWMDDIQRVLLAGDPVADARNPARRLEILEALERAGESYRNFAYCGNFPGLPAGLPAEQVLAFFSLLTEWADATIWQNRRPDGLFHSYNLMRLKEAGAEIRRLDPMLEGQVAVLGAGILSPAGAADLLDSLRESSLFCARRNSYLLYPDRGPIPFLEKNRLPAAEGSKSLLLAAMVKRGDARIVTAAGDATWRFHADFHNADCLRRTLESLAEEGTYGDLPREEAAVVEELYEGVFGHHAFTGRSGSMFAYEGLGSIYWHMVSKLLLAVQENLCQARAAGADGDVHRLDEHYDAIRDGLGFRKSAEEYGAFPTDPYSHTPAHAGAQQPGMTGQVKEEILTRRGELGLWVRDGQLVFERVHDCFRREIRETGGSFHSINAAGAAETISLPPKSLAYTICQTPVVCAVSADGEPSIVVHLEEGGRRVIAGNRLPRAESLSIFQRDGRVRRLEVFFPAASSDR